MRSDFKTLRQMSFMVSKVGEAVLLKDEAALRDLTDIPYIGKVKYQRNRSGEIEVWLADCSPPTQVTLYQLSEMARRKVFEFKILDNATVEEFLNEAIWNQDESRRLEQERVKNHREHERLLQTVADLEESKRRFLDRVEGFKSKATKVLRLNYACLWGFIGLAMSDGIHLLIAKYLPAALERGVVVALLLITVLIGSMAAILVCWIPDPLRQIEQSIAEYSKDD